MEKREKQKMKFTDWLALIVFIGVATYVVSVSDRYTEYQNNKVYADMRIEAEDQLYLSSMMGAYNELGVTKQMLEESQEKVNTLVKNYAARTILDTSKLPHPRYIVEVMFRMWENHGGVYDYVPYCIAAYESEYNTFKHNTSGEDSRGLFQVNIADPWHRERTNAVRLFEPVYNMEYQFDELVRFEKAGIAKGLTGIDLVLYVSRYGQRPNWEKCSVYITNRVTKAYNEFQSLKVN